MVLISLFRVKLDCCVFRTLGWHQSSSMFFWVFLTFQYMVTIGFHCIGSGQNSVRKPQNGYLDWKMSPQSTSTKWWVANYGNLNFRWKVWAAQGAVPTNLKTSDWLVSHQTQHLNHHGGFTKHDIFWWCLHALHWGHCPPSHQWGPFPLRQVLQACQTRRIKPALL